VALPVLRVERTEEGITQGMDGRSSMVGMGVMYVGNRVHGGLV
jgi:hypothetical protein